MRVTDTSLLGYRVTGQHRLSFIDCRKGVAVTTYCHIQTVCFIPMENHQISSHVFFFGNSIPITEITETCFSFSGSKQSRTKSVKSFIHIVVQTSNIHILGKHFPGIFICTDRHFQAIALIQQFHPEVFTDFIGYCQRLFFSPVHREILSIGYHSRVGFFIVVQQQASDVSISQPHFDFRFIAFIHSCN